MITEEYKEWLEHLYIGFTNALFGTGEIEPMFMVVVDKDAEVIPPAPPGVPMKAIARLVAAYANVQRAQFILHISQGVQIPMEKVGELLEDPNTHPDKKEMLSLIIGDPRGELHAIIGEISRAIDGTPYVGDWHWSDDVKHAGTDFILPFTD